MNTTYPPGLRGYPVVGVAPLFRKDPLAFYIRLLEMGPIVSFKLGPFNFCVVNEPEDIEKVLSSQQKSFVKSPTYKPLRDLLGNGLVTTDGSLWAALRRQTAPSFNEASLESFIPFMHSEIESLLDTWSQDGQPFNIADRMQEITLSVVCRTLFGKNISAQDLNTLKKSFSVIQIAFEKRLGSMFPILLKLPLPHNLRYKNELRKLHTFVDKLITERRAAVGAEGDPQDVLGRLFKDEASQEKVSPEDLRATVLTLLFAGHETTSSALSWTWHLLANHPEAYAKVFSEVKMLGAAPTRKDLESLKWTRQVLLESMRLYAPVPTVARQAKEPVVLGGYTLPTGTCIAIAPYSLHRNPKLWPNPEKFDPSRFKDDSIYASYKYLPFVAGPRKCLGDKFAIQEALLVIVHVLKRFDIRGTNHSPVPIRALTLRSRNGIIVKAVPR